MNTKILSIVFVCYLFLSGYTIVRHELWGDEVISWNIAKGSAAYPELITNMRYEGHPPVWFTILWSVSKFTHNVAYLKTTQWVIAVLIVFMILFLSPLPLPAKILIPFGYYFLFEYGVISRNYAIGVLFALCICYIIQKDFKYKIIVYYLLLLLLSNSHLLALLLAGSFHIYFLLRCIEQRKKRNTIIAHAILGFLILLPAVYFIFPPAGSQTDTHFWISKWNMDQVKDLNCISMRAFIPVPAWWKPQFWNTFFLIEAKTALPVLKLIDPLISLTILIFACLVLKDNRKCLALFLTNTILSYLVALAFFPLTSARYAGFVFIGFIVAFWLYCYESPLSRIKKLWIYTLLSVQALAGIFAASMDIRLPFSNLYAINALLKEVPAGAEVVTDYWTMNAYVAFTDKPAYCIDAKKEFSFTLWGKDIAALLKDSSRYADGVKDLFSRRGINSVYMVSMGSMEDLKGVDSTLMRSFRVSLIDRRTGAIEKGGNLYLYQITNL